MNSQADRLCHIDAYDLLGIDNVDCDAEEIKKAFRTKSLKCHPDKCQHLDEAGKKRVNEMWIKIQDAHEVLKEEDRRKRYNTFGIDLGQEPPEMEVWNIG